jgi:mediator of replication checkpoint protein 1
LGGDENRALQRRRTALTNIEPPTLRKPSTLAEIRESLSFLVEEPSMIPDSQYDDSDSEGDEKRPSATITARTTSRATVIDRLSLSRQSTLSETSATSLAFAALPKAGATSGFKVPSLIRRATSNLSNSTTTGSTTSSAGSSFTEPTVRRGGSNKSNIHYQAREAERKKIVEAAEEKRKAGLRRRVRAGGNSGLKGALAKSHSWD